MKKRVFAAAVWSLVFTAACGEEPADKPAPLNVTDAADASSVGNDTGAQDSGTSADTGTQDSGSAPDTAAAVDTGTSIADAGSADVGAADTGPADTGASDSGAMDAGAEDTGPQDAGTPDAGPQDAGPEDTGPEDTGPEDTGPEDTGPPLCDPPLKISPTKLQILPFDLHTFKASGGTGSYRFALTKDVSGAVLNQFTGAYFSGEKAGVTDAIELTDTGCVGVATATATVVKSMQLAPMTGVVGHGQTLTFKATDGSGSYSYSLKTTASGGTISKSTGAYKAGSKDGLDVIVATDTATGQTVTATITVKKDTVMYARPAKLVMPVGSQFSPTIVNGTGELQLSGGGGLVKFEKGAILAIKAGVATIVATDVFTKQKVNLKTRVVESFSPEQPSVGDGFGYAVARGAGDLNKDGFDDAVIGIAEADVEAHNDGAVLVYHGSAKGLGPKPVQVVSGGQRDGRFGSALEVADVDGDGRKDLIVGEHLGDHGLVNNGGVHVFRGLKDGTFETTATTVLKGNFSSAQVGNSLTVCDFNGDGRLDIAAGAPYGENRGKSPVFNDQGDVYIWLGHEDGFVAKADQHRYGQTLDKGKLVEKANLRIGWSLASGDIDGDGNCDLAVGSLHFPFNAANDGAVLVYKGVAANKDGNGGVSADPVLLISGADKQDKGAQFGRSIAMGDFDGDKRAELAVGYYALDTFKGKTKYTNAGATFLYNIDKLSSAPAKEWIAYDSTKWQVLGDASWDYFGRNVYAGDVDGDGIDELMVGNVADEVTGKPGGTGVLAIHKGVKGGLPSTTPAMEIPGLAGGDWFGAGAAAVGDVDKDGKADLLIFASHEDTAGLNHGMPYQVSTGAIHKLIPLHYVTKPSGNRMGQAVAAVGDVTGDGIEDVVVGAPYAEGGEKIDGKWAYAGTTAGAAFLFAGGKSGFSMNPKLAVQRYYSHQGGELLGWEASGAGDFDGDGKQDFAIVARNEDRLTTLTGDFETTKCGGQVNDGGAVLIFGGGATPSRKPIASVWGVHAYDYIQAVSGARKKGMGDINGDGRDDIVFGSLYWDGSNGRTNAGGWAVAWGRPQVAGKTRVICKPDYQFIGPKKDDYVGRSVAMIGDIDGDKCAEFAVGADAEDLGVSNQGSVRVIFGWGAKCKSTKPREVVLLPNSNNARAGYSLNAGGDVDGDGKNDLVVGGFNTLNGGIRVGAAWVVTAKYIASLKPADVADAVPPKAMYPLADPQTKLKVGVFGTEQNGYFGWSVAMVPGLESDGRAGIIVGVPRGAVGDKQLAGGALVYRFNKTTGLMQVPWAAFVGETYRPGGELGWSVSGASLSGKPAILMGGYFGSPHGLKTQVDQGTAYMSLID